MKSIILLLLGVWVSNAHSQKLSTIRLLDDNNSQPIVGATFKIAGQHGVSDDQGVIQFLYKENEQMNLSHVTYGTWKWTSEEISRLIIAKVFYQKSNSVNLYPITIIGVKKSKQPGLNQDIEYEDRMEHDAAEILNKIPAFNSIRKSGNYGFDPVFRGFKYDQLNIVMNGAQSATAACPNRMDPPTSQMSPNMMNQIEILKGPHALRYGTGMGATINFIPTNLNFENSPAFYGRLSSGFESNGEILQTEGQVGYRGAFYDAAIFGAWSEGGDYTAGNKETIPSDFTRGSFGSRLGFKLSSNQTITVSGTYNRARDTDFPSLPMDLREDDTWMFYARHDIQLQQRNLKSWNTTLYGSFVDHLMNNMLKPLNPRTLNASTAANTYNYGGRTEGIWQFLGSKLFVGSDFRAEGAKGIRSREFLAGPNTGNTVEDNAWQDGRIEKTGLFTEYQISKNKFRYVFSGRVEMNHAIINDAASEFSLIYSDLEVTQINPSASIGLVSALSTRATASIWMARAQRSGGLTERYINYFPVGQDPYEMLGNPNLDPEVNNQVDISFEWESTKAKLTLDYYVSYLQDYISSTIDPHLIPRLPMSPGVRQFNNINEVIKTGFEASWSQKLTTGLSHQLLLAYTYGQDMERHQPLPEVAPLDMRYELRGSFLDGSLKPIFSLRYVSSQSRVSEEFGETKSPSFLLLGGEIRYKISEKLKVQGAVQNLLNSSYYEHLSRSVRGGTDPIFSPGRNWSISFGYKF